jgi:PIN domain nuclease of toxin-antitoxin system
MRLLLDTHVALWAITDDPKLGNRAREHLSDPTALIFVSAATLWEIAIKHALRRADMPISAERAAGYFSQSGFEALPITWPHTRRVERLPPIHKDPFDRLLVAQSLEEPLLLLTHDATVASYADSIVFV